MRNWIHWPYFRPFLTLASGHNTAPSRWRRPRRSPSLTDDFYGGAAQTYAELQAGQEDILCGDSQTFMATDEFWKS